jgi:glycine cleavage system aminomethyltransferase T
MIDKNNSALALTIGPRVRKSPYFDATLRYGARAFTVYSHMYMPTVYTDPVTEYWQLVTEVTLWDVACERQVEITGPDACKFVQLLTPRDLSNCVIDDCRYVLLTDNDGGIVNDAVLLRLAENHFWLSPGDGDVLLWVQGIAAQADMQVIVCEPDVSPLQLQGPKAPEVARTMFGDVAIELGYFRMRQLDLDGIPLVLSRTGWSGEPGYELFLRDGSRGEELWEKVMAAGKAQNITPAAPNTIRSIEGAILSYCSDITRNDNPWTLGLGRLVNLDQEADFIGKNALKKIHAEGTKRRLVGVEIDGEVIPGNDAFWPVRSNDLRVGHLSRCAYSPRLGKNIGFVNVPTACAADGTFLQVETPSGVAEARVVPVPWFRPATRIPVTEKTQQTGMDS